MMKDDTLHLMAKCCSAVLWHFILVFVFYANERIFDPCLIYSIDGEMYASCLVDGSDTRGGREICHFWAILVIYVLAMIESCRGAIAQSVELPSKVPVWCNSTVGSNHAVE